MTVCLIKMKSLSGKVIIIYILLLYFLPAAAGYLQKGV